jgi:Flp pilus assembly protein TadB
VRDEWAQKWRSVPVEQRRRIIRAVAKGEAVADPRDAALALELIDNRERRLQAGRNRWFSRFFSGRHLVIFACFALVGVLLTRNYLVFGFALLAGMNLAALRVLLRRTERKTAEARQKNEQLAQL